MGIPLPREDFMANKGKVGDDGGLKPNMASV